MAIQIQLSAIAPKNPFDAAKIVAGIEKELEHQADLVQTAFKKTTGTWQTKVEFKIARTGDGERTVSTVSQIYEYVSKGTPPHFIGPKPGKRLIFRTPYTAKTSPGVLDSRAGGPGNNRAISIHGVKHPGTAPRDFDKQVKKVYEKKFISEMQKLVDKLVAQWA